MAANVGNPTMERPERVPELRSLQIARQRAVWEPCVACEQVKKKAYAPIAQEFSLRLYPRKEVTPEESILDEAEQSSLPEHSTPIIAKTLETSDSSTPSSGYGTDGELRNIPVLNLIRIVNSFQPKWINEMSDDSSNPQVAQQSTSPTTPRIRTQFQQPLYGP